MSCLYESIPRIAKSFRGYKVLPFGLVGFVVGVVDVVGVGLVVGTLKNTK